MKRKDHSHQYERMQELFKENPESKKLVNRYRTIRYTLYEEYQELMDLTKKDRMMEFLKDVLAMDRYLRDQTTEIEQEEKKILSQEWQLENGYRPNNEFIGMEESEEEWNAQLRRNEACRQLKLKI